MDLVIMAAGIGSRFGGGIKQLTPVGPSGEVILEYSVHDALEAGFDRVVFVTRKDLEKTFHEIVGDRIAKVCPTAYAFQELDDLPEGFTCPEGRTKPWGTGQAILCCRNIVNGPFAIINADDYYGKDGFRKVHDYLADGGEACMAGFVLKNTMSDNGSVTRGICEMDAQCNLTKVVETKNIIKTAGGAEADGVALDLESLVSMNMWGLTPDFLWLLEEGFVEFFQKEVPLNPLKAEYLIPTFIGQLLEQDKLLVKVLRTDDSWYGMTYKEDVPTVKESFREMLEKGMYREELFADL